MQAETTLRYRPGLEIFCIRRRAFFEHVVRQLVASCFRLFLQIGDRVARQRLQVLRARCEEVRELQLLAVFEIEVERLRVCIRMCGAEVITAEAKLHADEIVLREVNLVTNSEIAARRLSTLGYTNVREYAEGKEDWVNAGLPVERGAAAALR